MQTRVHGMALRRASAIGSPQSRQTPKVPFSMRISASSIAWRILASVCFNSELDVDFVVAGGLIGHVALAAVIVLHRCWSGLRPRFGFKLRPLLQQGVLIDRDVHRSDYSYCPRGSRQNLDDSTLRPRRERTRPRYSARKVASGFRCKTSQLRNHADDGDQQRGHDHADGAQAEAAA